MIVFSDVLLFDFNNLFIFICVYFFSSFHLQNCLALSMRISRYRCMGEVRRAQEKYQSFFFFLQSYNNKAVFVIVVKFNLHV